MIVIIDFGLGNLRSILNMLKRVGAEAMISGSAEKIESANALILPGVGAFDAGMNKIRRSGLDTLLQRRVIQEGCPMLGICLGMQLFCKESEEGSELGLGWLDARVVGFSFATEGMGLKIPHMGWNDVIPQKDSCLFEKFVPSPPRFYFAHSYHVICHDCGDVLSVTGYGYDFVSSVNRANIVGVQFHPEKSHIYGLRFLGNWVEKCR